MTTTQKEPLHVPRDAPVYASGGMRIGTVSGLTIQSLRIRQGRFSPRYLDVPATLVQRVEHGRVWLSQGVQELLAVGRFVSHADAPAALQVSANIASSSFLIPYEAPVYASDGAKIGVVADATRTTIAVRGNSPFAAQLALPMTVIDRVEGEKVWLNIPLQKAKQIGEGRAQGNVYVVPR